VDRGEMPIELGASWFSAKAIKVVRTLSATLKIKSKSKVGKALEYFTMKEKTKNDDN